MYDVIIVGGGPAGLAAAVYAARKRLTTLLLTGDIGGQVNLTNSIENYLGYQFIEGRDLIARFEEQVKQFPIDQKIGPKATSVTRTSGGFEVDADDGQKYAGKVVLFAPGKRPRQLNVPGEKELTGRGVTYCAICDGPLFSGQKVVVVGGGNSALEAALDMVNIAEWVYVVSISPLTGDAILMEKLSQAKNVTLFLEHSIEKVKGNDLVEGVVIKDLRTGETRDLDATGVFIEIGLTPNSDAVKGLAALNEAGEVVVNCNAETNVPGLYAAGDVTSVPEKQIVVAAGEGAKAALQAHRYLQRLPSE